MATARASPMLYAVPWEWLPADSTSNSPGTAELPVPNWGIGPAKKPDWLRKPKCKEAELASEFWDQYAGAAARNGYLDKLSETLFAGLCLCAAKVRLHPNMSWLSQFRMFSAMFGMAGPASRRK